MIWDSVKLYKSLLLFYVVRMQGFLTKDRVLIIAPTSLLSNWQREIESFAPDLNLLVYHGQNRELVGDYDVAITSYGLARRDKKELNKMKWFLLIIDEAQNIENPKTYQCIKAGMRPSVSVLQEKRSKSGAIRKNANA